MVRAALLVLLVLVLIAYGGMFLLWNQQVVTVTGFVWGGQGWVEDLPVGFLVLGGVLIGALVMAGFVTGSWHSQRSRCRAAEAQVEVAKKKLAELVAKVKEQRGRIQELEARLREKEEAEVSAPQGPSQPAPLLLQEPPALGEEDADI